MPSNQFNKNSSADIQQLLNSIAAFGITELEKFQKELNKLIAQKKAPSFSNEEADCLQVIYKEIPREILVHYDELYEKMQSNEITPEEHQELLALVDRVGKRDVERTEALFKLSQLRGVRVPELMKQLQIKLPLNV